MPNIGAINIYNISGIIISKIRIFDEKMGNYREHSGGVSKQKDFFKLKRPLVINDVLFEALKHKHISKNKILKIYLLLIYGLIRSKNTEALMYILKFKNHMI